MPTAEVDRLSTLDALRRRVQATIAGTSDTLTWFAERFRATRSLPTSRSRSLHGPYVRSSRSLGPTFELWHAMLRAERVLRLIEPKRAARLRKLILELKEDLSAEIQERAAGDLAAYARYLVSDDVYGTLSVLTAAAVLRSEIYPERSESTPSYLAGYILFAELKLAAAHAGAHTTTGLGDRPPRLALVSPAVHSLMLYVEHLRQRADALRRFAQEVGAILDLQGRLAGFDEPSGNVTSRDILGSAENGALRLSLSRLHSLCGRCGSLILATRTLFEDWQKQIGERIAGADDVTFEAVWEVFSHRGRVPDDADAGRMNCREGADRVREPRRTAEWVRQRQMDAHGQANEFSRQLTGVLNAIARDLQKVLSGEEAPPGGLQATVERLRAALTTLERLHVGPGEDWPYPSIRDAVRFQFLKSLIEACSVAASPGAPPDAFKAAAEILKLIADRFRLGEPVDWLAILKKLGAHSVGQALSTWWTTLAKCYHYVESDSTNEYPWIAKRHESYTIIEALSNRLSIASSGGLVCDALKTAADSTEAVAHDIELWVKKLTQWCAPYGQQLLLAHQTGQPGLPMDPLELVSALWIADRLGEPWPDALEEIAVQTVAQVQRPDGGFPAVTPLYDRGDFAYFAPSASVIACLARFVGRGGRTPATERERRRLLRWEAVLVKSTAFLLNTTVEGEMAGWHSDRHPAQDRIDSLTTTEAVKALCRIDDLLRWLVNLEAYSTFEVKWPERGKQPPRSLDVGQGSAQLIVTAMEVAESLRRRTSGYAGTQPLRDTAAATHSLLFYGPPGTGKTSLQEWVATDLEWPLVVVTIGDFLKEGEGNIGKKAVEIFRQLGHVSNSCIVFDEFDEMVAERSPRSDRFTGTRGAPALLTPMMLPLLSELRKRAESQCFLVSFTTNYVASIDFAARRAGRVDREILLVFPDFESRLLLVAEAATQAGWTYEDIHRIAEQCALCSLSTIRAYVAQRAEQARAVQASADQMSTPSADEAPTPAIQPDYYPSSLGRNRYLATEIVTLVKAIAPSDLREPFFESLTGRRWEELFLDAMAVLGGTHRGRHRGRLVKVNMTLTGAPSVSDGQVYFLLGAGPLGDWRPEKAERLHPDGDRWTIEGQWPVDMTLVYKFLRKGTDGAVIEWEAGPNRVYTVPLQHGSLVLKWRQ